MSRRRNQRKKCVQCQKEKILDQGFYKTNSPLFTDSRLPICRSCLASMVDEDDVGTLLNVLRKIDKPFIRSAWDSAKKSKQNTVRAYFRQINSFYKDLTYDDSESANDIEGIVNEDKVEEEINDEYDEIVGGFSVTSDMIRRWGKRSKEEYMYLENFYNEMISQFDISAPQDQEQIVTLSRLNLMRKQCLDKGDIADFAKLQEQYNKILQAGGLRAIDRKSSHDSRGIKSFGQLAAEVEKRGFIVPDKTEESQDIVDETIMYLVNYFLKNWNMQQLSEPPPDTPKVEDGDD